MASKFFTLFLILALNALQVYSQASCTLDPRLRFEPVVDETATDTVIGNFTVTGTFRVGLQVTDTNDESLPYFTAAHNPQNNIITIATTANFSRFLGIVQDISPMIRLRYACLNDPAERELRFTDVELQITDTDNEIPTIDLQGINEIKILLDTWDSNDVLTFLNPIIVEDLDYDLAFADVEIKSYNSSLVRVKSEKNPGRPHRWTTNLYLDPEAGPGNHTIVISAKDAVHTETNATIQLLISGGIQAQATTFVVAFFVGLAAYLNL